MVASLKTTRLKLSVKIAKLERELSFGREQLREAKGVVVSLKSTNEKLKAHASRLIGQALKAQ